MGNLFCDFLFVKKIIWESVTFHLWKNNFSDMLIFVDLDDVPLVQ